MNQIIQGDCFEALKEIPDNSVDLTCFSPPYDQIRKYHGFPLLDSAKRIELGKQLYRVAKEGSICAVVIGDQSKDYAKSLTSFRWAVEWCDNADWRLFETCIYERECPPGAWWRNRFKVHHEYVHLFLKGQKPKHFDKQHLMVKCKFAGEKNVVSIRKTSGSTQKSREFVTPDKKCRGTVWKYTRTSSREGNATKVKHPATYPDALAKDIILCFSAKNDIVLDPMIGSGTTAVVANQNNRQYIGIELSQEYCEIVKQRLEAEVNRDLFP